MLQKIFRSVVVLGLSACLFSCTAQENPAPQRAVDSLRFTPQGKFKILQLTDLHWHVSLPMQNNRTYYLIKHMVQAEQPHLVVITGDLALTPATLTAYYQVASLLEEMQVPFAVALGNHDRQIGTEGPTIFHLLAQFPHFVGRSGTVSGCGNYDLPVYGTDSQEPRAVLYVLDSHGKENLTDYQWIRQDQIDWFVQTDKGLPSWLFFHIPLPEIKDLHGSGLWTGECGEESMPPAYNSGFFDVLAARPHVRGVFFGHDHLNNFVGRLQGLWMGYGQHTGYGGYGYPFPCGGRVIELDEGSLNFRTYLIYSDLTVHYPVECTTE